jgi:hypothetical protein
LKIQKNLQPNNIPSLDTFMTNSLSYEQITTVVNGLPIQNRTMIRLLLIQYFDVPQDEIEFMATDQPDSRGVAGGQPEEKIFTREAVQDVANRIGQYQLFFRQKRERPALQLDCLQQMNKITDLTIRVAEQLLTTHFEVEQATLQDRKAQAPTILAKQIRRKLDRSFEQNDISEEEYKQKRLLLEYQLLFRKRERLRRRLISAKQEYQTAGLSSLQDHEIAHIWGIPLGSLAGRKVKALYQFISDTEKLIKENSPSTVQSSPERPDYWKEAFATLRRQPVKRSVVPYDGLERTEDALMDKLRAFATDTMSEEEEAKFWTNIIRIHDTEHSGMWKSQSRAIFALQRLSAILKEFDLSDPAIEENLLKKIIPPTAQEKLSVPEDEKPTELNEEALAILQKLVGEQDDKRRT